MHSTETITISKAQQFWFGVSCTLMGVIIGYVFALAFSATLLGAGSAKVAQRAPTPPTVPSNADTPPAGPVPQVDLKTDHVKGNKNARISLIAYSDFECPFSKRHHPTLSKVLDSYKNDVNIVYRHFPLGFHKNAQKEAEASECAAELGGNDVFWKYTDAIYEKTTSNGTGFALTELVPLAKKLGLSETKFQTCLDSGKYAQKVKDEQQKGAAAGVRGTPGNILIDHKTQQSKTVSGALPLESFKTVIDGMLGSK
jgi:protein-disulfide isomerase